MIKHTSIPQEAILGLSGLLSKFDAGSDKLIAVNVLLPFNQYKWSCMLCLWILFMKTSWLPLSIRTCLTPRDVLHWLTSIKPIYSFTCLFIYQKVCEICVRLLARRPPRVQNNPVVLTRSVWIPPADGIFKPIITIRLSW